MSEGQTEKIWEDTDKGVRGPNIPDDWKRYIMERALTEVNTPRMLLTDEILEQMKQSRDVKDKLPERESIAKLISRARNHSASPLDAPFSLASLAEYDIPPEAMPAIMWVYKKMFRESPQYFTIRQALWVARLYSIIESSDMVREWADVYAFREQVCWILGEPFFTRGLDVALIQYKYYGKMSGMTELGKRLSRYTPDRVPSPFPWGKEEEWEQRLKQKGYTLEPSSDDISDEERQFEAKIKEISTKLGLDE